MWRVSGSSVRRSAAMATLQSAHGPLKSHALEFAIDRDLSGVQRARAVRVA
jgi:hypothetical protein